MYSISDEYRAKMFDQVQTHKLSGTIGGIAFSGDDVIGVSYSNRCSDKKVAIGSVNIGVLKLTFLRDILNRGNYYNKEITLVDSLLTGYDLNDDPIFEDVPIGTFYVGDAVYTGKDMVDITAYDCLSFMDIPLTIGQTSGYIYDFCQVIESETGAAFAMTQEECEALPNADVLIGPYVDNDMSTFRDLLSKLAQMVGGFAYADRSGGWKLKTFDNTSILNIGKARRFSGAKFSDYQTRYDAISYQDVKTTGETVIVGDSMGVIMELGNNPFLQYGTSLAISDRVHAILNRVRLMTYTPFEVSMLPAFIVLDLGDVISFTNDYTLSTSTGAIMSLEWSYNRSFKVSCYGSNPNLRNGMSSTDHAIKGASSANREGRVATFTATNIQQVDVGNTKEKVISCYFSTSSSQAILTLTEIKFDLDSPGTVEVFYILDDDEIVYSPVETYDESGLHTVSLMYPVSVEELNTRHKFEVKMRTSSSLTVYPEYAHVFIQSTGYNLTGGWGGFIEATDTATLIDFGYLPPIAFTDTATIDASIVSNTYTPSDSMTVEALGSLALLALTDTATMYMQTGFKRITEGGDQRITEDGYRRITE